MSELPTDYLTLAARAAKHKAEQRQQARRRFYADRAAKGAGEPSLTIHQMLSEMGAPWRWYGITPMPAPRQVKSDRWKPREMVVAYRQFRDECLSFGMQLPDEPRLLFAMPMPASWSDAKKRRMEGQPHQVKPDLDNLIKAVLDAVEKRDQKIASLQAWKVYSRNPGVAVIS